MTAQSRHPVILLTRPKAQSARFAALLSGQHPGLDIVISPLLEPHFPAPALPARPASAVILTSETGVEAARRLLAQGQDLPRRAFCVGDQTARAAREAGFDALSAKGDAAALLTMILAQDPAPPLLHLHGRDTRGNIAESLNSAGIETFSCLAYAQDPLPLSDRAVQVLHGDQPVLAPVFSPRSAVLLAAECARIAARAPLTVIAISAAAARPFAGADVLLAAHPDADAMRAAISMCLATLNPPPSRH